MTQSPDDGSLRAEVKDLRERVAALERVDRLGSTSFREPGKIRYLDAAGNVRLLFGTLLMPDGTELGLGLLVQRADGTDVLQAWDGQASMHHADGTVGIAVTDDLDQVQLQGIDGLAGIIVQTGQRDIRYADDETREAVVVTGGQAQVRDWDGNVVVLTRPGGLGLNRPALQWTMHQLQTLSQMGSTMSASFVATHTGYLIRASLNATVLYRVICDAGTSAEVRLVDRTNGDDVLATNAHGVGADAFSALTGEQNGVVGSGLARMELQARRTAGTGTVYVQVVGGYQN